MLFKSATSNNLKPSNHRPLWRGHDDAIALQNDDSTVTYNELLKRSQTIALSLLAELNTEDLAERRVGFLLPAGADYIAVQWGIWKSGGIALPLSLSATAAELEYLISDAGATFVVVDQQTAGNAAEVCRSLGIPMLQVASLNKNGQSVPSNLPDVGADRNAMILYTSGTTSRPKGVVSTHAMIESQINTLIEAWHWQSDDRIPLFLPLHHIHGIINVMSCALRAGATIDPFPRFDMDTVLARVADHAYTVFMAVPTIYFKIIQAIEAMPETQRQKTVAGFAAMRLMVSGSAALPETVHRKWTELTGQILLERYGMTEIGMGLSNPYHGQRRAGMVGQPLSGVEVRLKSEEDGAIITKEHVPGEIQVRGPSVFQQYWNLPAATAESFDDGWFRTGDIAVVEDGYYRILGRQSVDIIKSGGYKISALEIEAVLLDHPDILECAVVGAADELWGEAVAVAVVFKNAGIELESLRDWCRDRLSKYKIPQRLLAVSSLPRNAMGKVTKAEVQKLFEKSVEIHGS